MAVAETAAIHLKGPTGELLFADAERTKPIRIVIFSPGSAAFDALESRQSARQVQRLKANDGEMAPLTAEERRRDTVEDLVTITSGFENFEYGTGLQGAALFKAVYSDPKLGFIHKQVTKFIGDWGNFTGK
ncbi:hypothetical protein [Sphingomonas sp.]|uniref:hypothetical protein n=1 Tax=Sphingomonas sp. TaxID=28214 RepID=UPI0028A9ADFB|nr:hypothetical protein [Sphingomonas sp.]